MGKALCGEWERYFAGNEEATMQYARNGKGIMQRVGNAKCRESEMQCAGNEDSILELGMGPMGLGQALRWKWEKYNAGSRKSTLQNGR